MFEKPAAIIFRGFLLADIVQPKVTLEKPG